MDTLVNKYGIKGSALTVGGDQKVSHKRRNKRINGPFLKGPIPMAWLEAASNLLGKSLHVGIWIWYQHGLKGSRTFKVSLAKMGRKLGFKRGAAGAGLLALEEAGLISVERHPGRSPIVTLKAVPDGSH